MKILFVSLGCDKNSVDSEVMLGFLNDEGFSFTDDEEEAEAAIVNTCCFIGDAKEESINTVIELGRRRMSGQYKALIITGCLAYRYFDEIHKELPEVDCIVTNTALDRIAEALNNVLRGTPRDFFLPADTPPKGGRKRIITTGGYYDYLKIAEGCDKRCTYCIIPYVKGKYQSIPMEELISEAYALAEKGVRELILVAQETTLYGVDLYGQKSLPQLLKRLCEIEGLRLIRLMYCYPEEITDELIAVIASEEKIVNYLDIPIQSGSDRILKLMGRKTSRSEIKALVKKLRERIPGICIRTTLITGFPSESEEDHNDTLALLKELKFDRVGAFTYSGEEGTPAFSMEGMIPDEVSQKRRDELMLCQQEISLSKNRERVGTGISVMVEGRIPEEGVYVGRSYMDAPDVDGYVFFESERELLSGDIVNVRVTDFDEYDLTGELI